MARVQFIWDLEDDRDGNYWHICVEGHGVTLDEVEEVVFERVTDDPLTVYPITAYEVPPPRATKTRKKQ